MKVKCIFNHGKHANANTLNEGHYTLLTDKSGMIEINKDYYVYGIALGYSGNLTYLIADGGISNWIPAEFFEVIDPLLPVEQYFVLRESNERMQPRALWGYKELIEKQDHYQGLWLSEKEDREIFALAKKRIDKDNMYDVPPDKDDFTDWLKGKPIE